MASVLGLDACKAGWVGIRLHDDQAPTAFSASTVAQIVDLAGTVEVVAIDIPIGLPTTGGRVSEALARKIVGRRASSVFSTPPRAVLEAGTHADAIAVCNELTGGGVSAQAYALRTKIFEVDRWVATAPMLVVEVHPEVSFATLAGRPLAEPKSTWSGFQLRRRILAGAGIVLDDDLGLAGHKAAPDDVLDAAVAAWTAQRVAAGAHLCLPDPPEVLSDGRRSAIWA